MRISALRLQDFRNYTFQEVELGAGLHVFEGRNAQGKTALLEAVYLGATARSFRTSKEADLIRWGQPDGGLHLAMERDSGRPRQLTMRWQAQPLQRHILLQNQPVRRLADFLSELPLALFTPDDLELVQGGPEMRRGYLDLLLCKLYPAYLEALGRYQKVLRQKGALLRAQSSRAELESWDQLLVQFGSQLMQFRAEICRQLEPRLTSLYAEFSGETCILRLVYRPCVEHDFGETLRRAHQEEWRRRTCLVGPHRDEVQLSLGEALVRRFGSQGQRRTLALAMRLAQAEMLLEIGKERPVVLLDDCFSELDPGRQARLLRWLEGASQVLITTATPLDLSPEHRLYRVEEGRVRPC
ncbi:MAG: DNA replication/repair protein RecF [Candidatus Eremiobacteraeota bacterium]|nr:DNA replication/repair protein RecF [Candidatus Eremiobacteraeota bacterium]